MSEERSSEGSEGAVMDKVRATFDPWLESRKRSNTLIILLLILAALPIIGIGLATTRTILPRERATPQEIPAEATDLETNG